MTLTYVEINHVKDLQVSLKECNFSIGATDGIWGGKSASALTTVLKDYDYRVRGPLTDIKDLVGNPNRLTGKELYTHAIKEIQVALKRLGLYDSSIDGIWGSLSKKAMAKAFVSYRAYNGVAGYDICYSADGNVNETFLSLVKDYCRSKDFYEGSANGLMACMHFESGGTFSPSIQNMGGSRYFGLIQFGEAASKDLGYSLDTVRNMSQLEQLEKCVFPYFDMWMRRGKKITQLEDFYLTILYPAAVGKRADEVLFFEGTKVYSQNRGLDINRDGEISIGEISRRLYDVYYAGMEPSRRNPLKRIT